MARIIAVVTIVLSFLASQPVEAERPPKARVTVENHGPYIYKLQVGHSPWKAQKGLFPGQSGVLKLDVDEEHVIRRKYYVNGIEIRDEYRIFVPKETTEMTVVFGGVQRGAVINHSSYVFLVSTPAETEIYGGKGVIPAGVVDNVHAPVGKEIAFTFWFKKNGWPQWYKVVILKEINDIHDDNEIVDKNGVKHLRDWTLVVDDRFFENY